MVAVPRMTTGINRHIGSPVSFRPFSIPTRKASPVSSSHNTSMAVTWNSRWAPSYVEGRSLEGINDVALSHAAQIVLVEEGAAEADGVNLGEDHLGTHKFTHARKNNTKTKHTQVNFYSPVVSCQPQGTQKLSFRRRNSSKSEWVQLSGMQPGPKSPWPHLYHPHWGFHNGITRQWWSQFQRNWFLGFSFLRETNL